MWGLGFEVEGLVLSPCYGHVKPNKREAHECHTGVDLHFGHFWQHPELNYKDCTVR